MVATASTEEKRRVALDLGAEEALAYEDFDAEVRADVVLDSVGGDVFERSLGVLNPLGSLIGIGFAGGWWKPVDPGPIVGRNVAIVGFYLGRLMRHRPAGRAAGDRRAAAALGERDAEAARRRRPSGSTDVADAHRLIDERRHVGKVVLVP